VKLSIRTILLACCAALIAAVSIDGYPQSTYPLRAVRLVVPSSAGGGTDTIARIIAPRLSDRLGQPVIVDNRPGAASILGVDYVAKSAPDGYTMVMAIGTLTILPAVNRKMPYNVEHDLAPVTQVASLPNLLVVHPSIPVQTVKDLIAFARARPGQLNFGSPGTGSNPHLAMALFLTMGNLSMVHIPYKGSGPMMIDLLAGHISLTTATLISAIPHVRSGRVRALGVSGAQRSRVLPDVPTIAETGLPGYEVVQWYGLLAPAKTPLDIIARLHRETAHVVQLPEIREKLAADGAEPVVSTPDQFARDIRIELAKWAKVVHAAGIKPE
jgi:tripartite-type tricarboxylate transporter receptor subunit TctC